jgi:hypothetical protein
MMIRLKEWVSGKSKRDQLPDMEIGSRQESESPSSERSTSLDRNRGFSAPEQEGPMIQVGAERPKIMVAVEQPELPDCVMDYTVHLAERLRYDILAMHVGNLAQTSNLAPRLTLVQEQYSRRAKDAAEVLKRKANQRGIQCEHVVRFGDLANTVGKLHQEFKRIEFVITDSEANKEQIYDEVTIPVFSVTPTYWWSEKGEKIMSKEPTSKKKQALGKAIGFGIASAGMYAAVFAYSDTIMKYFTRGSWYAALPIVTVFAFSYVHGAFAGHLWSALGIEAKKKDTLHVTEEKVVQPRKQLRKKPRAHAYVNPWHRI